MKRLDFIKALIAVPAIAAGVIKKIAKSQSDKRILSMDCLKSPDIMKGVLGELGEENSSIMHVEVNGKPYWYYKSDADAYVKWRNDYCFKMLKG